ncbi:AaceriADR151Wp [[Ashbya] aceris (nom. inval.)]|nr:AaceriADR151Wp [[Ashbya] aceris (nom. inval.)]
MLPDPSIRLRKAIIEGKLIIVKQVLRRWPELLTNIDPSNGWSSLHYAAYYGRYLICVQLIQQGHDRQGTLRTFAGCTSVHLALQNGHEQTTHFLLQSFPQTLASRDVGGRTPAHIACMQDYHTCLSLLSSAGADLSLTDNDGNTPLHIAMMYNSVNCIRLLVLGALDEEDYVRKNNAKWTPEQLAGTMETQRVFQNLVKEAEQQRAAGIPRPACPQALALPGAHAKADELPCPSLLNVRAFHDASVESDADANAQPQKEPSALLPLLPAYPNQKLTKGYPKTPTSNHFNSTLSSATNHSSSSLTRIRTFNDCSSSLSSESQSLPQRASGSQEGQWSVKNASGRYFQQGDTSLNTMSNLLPANNTPRNRDAELINKYLVEDEDFRTPSPLPLHVQQYTKSEKSSGGGHQSLLNIPISKVRI